MLLLFCLPLGFCLGAEYGFLSFISVLLEFSRATLTFEAHWSYSDLGSLYWLINGGAGPGTAAAGWLSGYDLQNCILSESFPEGGPKPSIQSFSFTTSLQTVILNQPVTLFMFQLVHVSLVMSDLLPLFLCHWSFGTIRLWGSKALPSVWERPMSFLAWYWDLVGPGMWGEDSVGVSKAVSHPRESDS